MKIGKRVCALARSAFATVLAAALALTMLPSAALADTSTDVGGGFTVTEPEAEGSASNTAGDAESGDTAQSQENQPESNSEADTASEDAASTEADLGMSEEGDAGIIPAAMERINEDVALTQPIAQQESTRSYFLAQTLESTKTVPIVSANLPLDTSMVDVDSEVVESAEGEDSNDAAEEGGEDSDESDLASGEIDLGETIVSDEDDGSNQNRVISPASTVIGSFTYLGMTFAVEPGGESVALVAVDHPKLPHAFLEAGIIVVADTVTADGIDYYSVTRIADDAFASLISNDEEQAIVAEQSDAGNQSNDDGLFNEADQAAGSAQAITTVVVPASVTSIDDEAFAGSDSLQYVIVEEGNPNFASYDGALYSADLSQLRSIPGGRVGAVRVAPSATDVAPEAFSHCASITTLVADPASIIWQKLQESDLRNDAGTEIELIDLAEATAHFITEPFSLDVETKDGIRAAASKELTGLSDIALSNVEGIAGISLEGRSSYAVHEVKTLTDCELVLYALGGKNNDTPTPFVAGRIDSGESYYVTYIDANGKTKDVCGVKINAFTYFKANKTTRCGASIIRDMDWTTMKAAYKAWGYTGITSFNGPSDASIHVATLNKLSNGGEDVGRIQFYPEHLSEWHVGTGRDYITNRNSGFYYNSSEAEVEATLDAYYGLFPNGEAFANVWTYATDAKWINDPGVPTRKGYTLDEISDSTKKIKYNRGGTPGKNWAQKYYARWSPIKYDLVFDKNNAPSTAGSIDPMRDVAYDTTVTLPAGSSLTWPGHYFVEWNTKSDGSGTSFQGSTGYSNFRATPGETKLYAIWGDNPTYTISYEMNGHGSKPTSPTSYTQGVGATLPTSTTVKQTGWVFDGWYKESSFTNKATSVSTTDSGNKTFYAKWTRTDIYTITLNSQLWQNSSSNSPVCDATSAGTQYLYYWVDKGWFTSSNPADSATGATTATALITKPTLNGYTFKGYWTGKVSSGTQWITDAGKLVYTTPPAVSNKAATWYAHWTINSVYTITLNSQLWPSSSATSATCNATSAGTGTVYYWVGVGWFTSSKSYGAAPTGAANTTSALITTPTLTGYAFGGYWTTKTGPSTSTRKISDAGVLSSTSAPSVDSNNTATWYAKWTKTSVHTITLNSQLWNPSNTSSVVCNATTPGTTAIYYWVDKGWYNASSPAVSDTAASTSTTLVTVPSLSGYTFKGYFTDKNGYGDQKVSDAGKLLSTNSISSGATWYAKWTIKSVYSLTLNSQLWASSSAGTPVCNATTAGTGALYYWEGVGWFNATKAQGAAPTGAATTSTELIGTLPSLNGYAFGGYYDGKSGSGNPKTSGKKLSSVVAISGNATWYAKWTIKSVYTFALNSQLWAYSWAGTPVCNATNPGTTALYYWDGVGWFNESKSQGAAPTGAAKDTDELITNLPTLNGYTFEGYFTGKDGSGIPRTDGKKVKSTGTISSGTTWYAKWTIKPVYTVTLNSQLWDSASATKAKSNATTPGTAAIYYWDGVGWFNASKSQGAAPTGAAAASNALITVPTLTGYSYGGYYTGKVGNGTKRIEGSTLKPLDAINSDATWYANWTINSYKVHWDYDGGDGGANGEETKSFGERFHMKDPGAKTGYEFTGWKSSGTADNGNTYGKDYVDEKYYTMPDGEVWFKATWSKHPYTTVNLSDPYLSEPSAQGAVYYWPEQGYVQSQSSTDVKTAGIVTPPNLTRLGYDFLGWYDIEAQNENSDAHKMIDANGDMVKSGAPSPNTEGGTVVWYAHWSRPACPVVLVASYAPSGEEDPFEVLDTDYLTSISRAVYGTGFDGSVEAGKIAEDKLPKRTGYAFKGYFARGQENAELYKGDAPAGTQWIAADGTLSASNWNEPAEKRQPVTLYAAWEIDQCEVTFDVRTNVKQNTETVSVVSEGALDSTTWYYGKPKGEMPKVTESTFFRTGYAFGGWYYLKDANGDDVESNRRFVSDKLSQPIDPVNWDVEKKDEVTLYPYWTAKSYTLVFDDNLPKIEGLETQGATTSDKSTTVRYDDMLDLSEFTPSFDPYTFAGWYTKTDQLFEGTHMTDNGDSTKRFTPRGMYASQSEIELHALWNAPGTYHYTLLWKAPGATEISESVHTYYFSDTIKFNGTEAPTTTVAGWRFEGWVEIDSYKAAHDALAASEPYKEGETTDGFKPISSWDRFFVAKWTEKPFSVSFSTAYTEANEEGVSWLMATDLLENWTDENGSFGSDLPWSEACKRAAQTGSDMSTGIVYDVNMPSFTLPDVKRKGQVFEGWKLLDENGAPSHDAPARGIVIEPSEQDKPGMRDLVYVPVFKDAYYTIVLDANGFGEEVRFEGDDAIPYSGEFTFPYPSTLSTGSVFDCWAADTNSVSDGTFKAYPDTDPVKIAPVYNEMGEMVEFGLAQLADERNVITLYAVWNNANYHVDVPLFANLAIDTERGDVIAGINTIAPSKDNEDKTATYRVESIRYEPLKNGQGEDAKYAFERPGTPTDKVYLSVYAGLNTGEATDLAHLLYAENVRDAGELTYTDADGNVAKAKPLLIELGGANTVLYGRTAPTGQTSLAGVTDEDAPYGFVTFSASNPLTIRYGLYFESDQTRKDFAFGSGKYEWLLPRNDGANKSESTIASDPNYGRGNAWSGDTVDVAKLHYTVSLVNNTK